MNNKKCANCGAELFTIGNFYVCESCGNKIPLGTSEILEQKYETEFYDSYLETCKKKIYKLNEPKNYIEEVAQNTTAHTYRSDALYKMEEVLQRYYESVDKAIKTTPGDEKVKNSSREILNNEGEYFRLEYQNFLENEINSKVEEVLRKKDEKQMMIDTLMSQERKEYPSEMNKYMLITASILGLGTILCCLSWNNGELADIVCIGTAILMIISAIPLIGLSKKNKEYQQYMKSMDKVEKIKMEMNQLDKEIRDIFQH